MQDQFVSGGYLIVGQQIATYLAAMHVRLFVNNKTINANTVIGDLIEATFTGYTAQAVATPDQPVKDPVNGGFSTFLPSHVFSASAPIDPTQTVYGWYITDTGGNLIAAGNLENPVVIADDGDSVPLQVTLNFPG